MSLLRPFWKQGTFQMLPCLIWLGGGGYRNSTPNTFIPMLNWFARKGFAVVSVQYRNSDEGTFPVQIQDVKEAIRFLRRHHEQYGIDPQHIAIAGESAGGHLATLAAYAQNISAFSIGDWLDENENVQALINWYGPSDFMETGALRSDFKSQAMVNFFFGGSCDEVPELYCMAEPKQYISAKTPPTLIMHGQNDPLVSVEGSKKLYHALKQAGANVDLYILEGAGHGTIEFAQQEVWELMRTFLCHALNISE